MSTLKKFQKSNITDKTFSAELKILIADNRKTRELIQRLAICAFANYADSGQTAKVKQVYVACKGIGAHPQFLAFVKAHTNIHVENVGKKNFAMSKREGSPAQVNELSGWWHEYEKAESAPAKPSELSKMLESFIKTINTKVENHKLADGQDTLAPEFIKYLESYTGLNKCDTVAPELKAVA